MTNSCCFRGALFNICFLIYIYIYIYMRSDSLPGVSDPWSKLSGIRLGGRRSKHESSCICIRRSCCWCWCNFSNVHADNDLQLQLRLHQDVRIYALYIRAFTCAAASNVRCILASSGVLVFFFHRHRHLHVHLHPHLHVHVHRHVHVHDFHRRILIFKGKSGFS